MECYADRPALSRLSLPLHDGDIGSWDGKPVRTRWMDGRLPGESGDHVVGDGAFQVDTRPS